MPADAPAKMPAAIAMEAVAAAMSAFHQHDVARAARRRNWHGRRGRGRHQHAYNRSQSYRYLFHLSLHENSFRCSGNGAGGGWFLKIGNNRQSICGKIVAQQFASARSKPLVGKNMQFFGTILQPCCSFHGETMEMKMKTSIIAGLVLASVAGMTSAASAQNGAAGGAVTGAVVGGVVGGPVGAAVGAAAGATAGGIADDARPRFRSYVTERHYPSYRYQGEVQVGATLPTSGVTYYEVPREYGAVEYRYTIVNDRTVLVDPRSHRIVQVIE
jgi:Protein of unknown function (DUF1236)